MMKGIIAAGPRQALMMALMDVMGAEVPPDGKNGRTGNTLIRVNALVRPEAWTKEVEPALRLSLLCWNWAPSFIDIACIMASAAAQRNFAASPGNDKSFEVAYLLDLLGRIKRQEQTLHPFFLSRLEFFFKEPADQIGDLCQHIANAIIHALMMTQTVKDVRETLKTHPNIARHVTSIEISDRDYLPLLSLLLLLSLLPRLEVLSLGEGCDVTAKELTTLSEKYPKLAILETVD